MYQDLVNKNRFCSLFTAKYDSIIKIVFTRFGKCKAFILKARDVKSSRGTMVYVPKKLARFLIDCYVINIFKS
jgi:hypothetical protein